MEVARAKWTPAANGLTLLLPGGPESGGFLMVPHPDSESAVEVELLPAKVRVLLALRQAMEADAGLPETIRGWRSPLAISELIAAQSRWSVPLEPQTVRTYVTDIHRRIRERVRGRHRVTARRPSQQSHRDVPQLFERRRHFGIRLACPLHVIDVAARVAATE
jgi:hypothetical protein